MSRENIEIVRNSYRAYVRGDLEAAFGVLDPAIEIYDHDIPDAGKYHGWEGMLAWQTDWESGWKSWRWDPEDFIDAGDRVVAILHLYAHGRGSGVDVEGVDGAVWMLSDGKAIRLDYYGSKEQAMEAVRSK